MKAVLVQAVLLSAMWLLRAVGGSDTEVVQIKPTAAVMSVVAALAGTGDSGSRDGDGATTTAAAAAAAAAAAVAASAADDGASPCDRYQRAAEPEVRNPRNHKFVTSNGWANRQRPKPEINVYSRVEEVPTVQSPSSSTAAYYRQHQHETYYQQQPVPRQQPANVRTSKRIIYYATLPDVVRRPQPGYAQLQQQLQIDPYALGPGPFSADYRQLDRNPSSDSLQPGRLAPYENAYDRGGGAVTSVTSKSTTVYNGRYDEPAEFRDSFYRPNELTTGTGSSRFAPWAEPFYKSWTSSAWDKDRPSFPWSSDDRRPSRWDDRGAVAPWENRGSSWDKDLVEVPLQRKPPVGPSNRNDFEPEVAVIKSGVIDVRGDRQPPPPPPPPSSLPQSRFTIVDVDPKPYNPQLPPAAQREDVREYDRRPQQKPVRYEAAYTPIQPIQPPGRFADRQQPPSVRYEQQYPPPSPPLSMRYEQQYPPPPQQQQQPPSSTRNGQNQPPNGYYETVKNTHHQFMTSWTEVTEHGDGEVTPTQAVSVDVVSAGNNTGKLNGTRITPNTINVTAKSPK